MLLSAAECRVLDLIDWVSRLECLGVWIRLSAMAITYTIHEVS